MGRCNLIISEEQLQWAIRQSEQGISKQDIARQLGIGYKLLLSYLRKINILKSKKDAALYIANELRYPQSIKDQIKKATCENEITRALRNGREIL